MGVTLAVMAVVLIAGLAGTAYNLEQGRHQDRTIKRIAVRADAKAERNRVLATLSREKVCSESSNQAVACRALFNRLAGNISESQKQQLACSVLARLQGPVARQLQSASRCP